MKLNEIKKAEKNIQEFCDQFSSVITITNAKGTWTARITRKSVQIFLITGESLLDAYMRASEACYNKRKILGV